jgi:hypothetical protein
MIDRSSYSEKLANENDPDTLDPENTLFVIIGVDVDPVVGYDFLNDNSKEKIWEETIDAVSKIKRTLEPIKDSDLKSPRYSWFLRSDWEMYQTCEDWCFPARRFFSLWNEFVRSGDEIGWHCHLARRNDVTNSWYQETDDADWIEECLRKGYHEISNVFEIHSSRSGWKFHSNLTMKTTSELGISFDLSALPGGLNHKKSEDLFDWIGTPNHPYHPSETNYRLAGSGPQRLRILEIPLSVRCLPWYFRLIDKKHPMPMNLSSKPCFFSNLSNDFFTRKFGTKFCSVYFHPKDVIREFSLFKSQYYCKKNLSSLLNTAYRNNTKVRFMTVKEFGNYWIRAEAIRYNNFPSDSTEPDIKEGR